MNRTWTCVLALLLMLSATAVWAQDVPKAGNPHGNISLDCSLCHAEGSWQPSENIAEFDHSTTGFVLEGRHLQVQCRDCHEDPRFAFVGTSCGDCHADIHQGRLGPDCRECHNPTGWVQRSEQRLAHDKTSFPLIGAHSRVDCEACHADALTEDYSGTPTACAYCHADTWQATRNPSHEAAGFSQDCLTCHSAFTSTWGRGDFVHPAEFPLEGGHAGLDCVACHSDGFGAVAADCYACHQDDFEGTRDPNHVASEFPTSCTSCHTTTAWEPANFDHNTTAFPLIGEHVSLDCRSCHENGYVGTSTDCYICHVDDYNGSNDPDHTPELFPTASCAECHTPFGWDSDKFDHNTTTFPLSGAHESLDCLACHETGYTDKSTDCYACHQDDYEGSTDPNHVEGAFSTACAVCHSTTAWEPASFDHNATAFPLTGAHEPLDCLACHESGYVGTSPDCYFCHQDDYEGSTDPNHVEGAFSTACAVCHSTTAWKPASFDHNATAFPLTGAHAPLDCLSCHESGYVGTPSECSFCHQDDYDGTTNPNHQAAVIPNTCADCHNTTAWRPGTFDHNATAFQLTGAHLSLDCVSCHQGGFAGIGTDCTVCHQDEYDNTNNPDHGASQFPTSCTDCHTTNAWRPSTWDHEPLFPIESGKHRNIDCIQCHVVPSNYSLFECILCHEHNQSDMDDKHRNNNNYQYNSPACYRCHPRGNG